MRSIFSHINLARWSSYSAPAHSVWQIRASSSHFCERPCQLYCLGPQSHVRRIGALRYPSSRQESLPSSSRSHSMHVFIYFTIIFFSVNSWINECAGGFIIKACLCQAFYHSDVGLRPALQRARTFALHTTSSSAESISQCILASDGKISWNIYAYHWHQSRNGKIDDLGIRIFTEPVYKQQQKSTAFNASY